MAKYTTAMQLAGAIARRRMMKVRTTMYLTKAVNIIFLAFAFALYPAADSGRCDFHSLCQLGRMGAG